MAPPPAGSASMQQEYAAGCAALLDGMSSFDSSPEQSRTSLLDASPSKPDVAPNHATKTTVMLTSPPGRSTHASKPMLAAVSTGQSGSEVPAGSAADALKSKLETNAFLPGPEGVTLDVRTLQVERDFTLFVTGDAG